MMNLNEAAFASVNFTEDNAGPSLADANGDEDCLRLNAIDLDMTMGMDATMGIAMDADADREMEMDIENYQPVTPEPFETLAPRGRSPSPLGKQSSSSSSSSSSKNSNNNNNNNNNKTRQNTNRNRILLVVIASIVILATTAAIAATRSAASHPASFTLPTTSTLTSASSLSLSSSSTTAVEAVSSTLVSTHHDSSSSSSSSNGHPSNTPTHKSCGTAVPFANRHNLHFDGILLIKNDNLEDETHNDHESTSSSSSDFDAYAKTLDSLTELRFSPGESTTTKEILLTTNAPDLIRERSIRSNPSQAMASEPVVLSLLFTSNGELWLPKNTGKHVENISRIHDDGHHHYTYDITKTIYGPGDRFVLTVSDTTIALFRNDHRELVGMWENPTASTTPTPPTPAMTTGTTDGPYHRRLGGNSGESLVVESSTSSTLSSSSSSSSLPLYAQIWFKDPKTSMVASAVRDTKHECR